MICKTCQTDKPEDGFYASNKTKCKECVKAAATANRLENIERVRSHDRLRGSMPHRVSARIAYQKTTAFAQSHRAAAQRWQASHPERRKANVIVGNAMKAGKLEPQPCWCCGNKAEAHHPDYSRPLDVVWLCPPHHKEVHALAAH